MVSNGTSRMDCGKVSSGNSGTDSIEVETKE